MVHQHDEEGLRLTDDCIDAAELLRSLEKTGQKKSLARLDTIFPEKILPGT
jgi:hypothetical protein